MTVSQDHPAGRGTRFYLALATLLIASIPIPMAAKRMGIAQGLAVTPFVILMALALLWTAYEAIQWQRRSGNLTPANLVYHRRMFSFVLLFMIVLVTVNVIQQRAHPQGGIAIFLALLPGLPMLGVIWSMGQYLVDEKDEYLRNLVARRALMATGFQLAVTMVWGQFERHGMLPHFPASYAFIIWCIGLGLAGIWDFFRCRTA